MNKTKLIGLMVFLIVLNSFAVLADGVCSLGLGTKASLEIGDDTTVGFVNLYSPATAGNVTLDISGAPGVIITTGDNPQDGVVYSTVAEWDLEITGLGDQVISATMVDPVNGTVLCTNSTTFRVIETPNITATISDIGDLVVNEDTSFLVLMNNVGDGDATDIQGTFSTRSGSTVTPNLAESTLPSGSTESSTHTLTPNVCGTLDAVEVVISYNDIDGNTMRFPATDVEEYNVIGSDVAFTIISATPNTINGGDTVTFGATIENLGTMDAENIIVSFEVDGIVVGSTTPTSLAIGASESLTYDYVTGVGGDHALSAYVIADHECSSDNNRAGTATSPLVTFTVNGDTPVCGDAVCQAGETCSSCPGDCGTCPAPTSTGGSSGGGGGGSGSSSKIYYLSVTAAEPTEAFNLQTGDTVKYVKGTKDISFVLRGITTSQIQVGVSGERDYASYTIKDGESENIDIDGDGKADFKLETNELSMGRGQVIWTLLNVPERTPIVLLPPRSTKKVVEPVVEQTVEPLSEPEEEEKEEPISEGELEFVESTTIRDKSPIWGGLGIAAAIIVLGLVLYFVIARKSDE